MKAPRASKLVVVIEDDPLVLEATESLLRSWGCQVVGAESYSEAMRKLTELGKRPDLIVCDYRLPQGATGVDAIEMLRDAFEIPALLISADASSPVSAERQGGYHLLHKPVNAAAFRAALIEASVLRR
jgi:two-component system, sensor histidine kinase